MSLELDVAAVGGKEMRLTGEKNGPFLIHKNVQPVFVEGDDLIAWSVTHIRTGLRFPWAFFTNEAAEAFAQDVLPVMDWDSIQAELPKDRFENKAVWLKGMPTKEQHERIVRLSKQRGGIRIANQGSAPE